MYQKEICPKCFGEGVVPHRRPLSGYKWMHCRGDNQKTYDCRGTGYIWVRIK